MRLVQVAQAGQVTVRVAGEGTTRPAVQSVPGVLLEGGRVLVPTALPAGGVTVTFVDGTVSPATVTGTDRRSGITALAPAAVPVGAQPLEPAIRRPATGELALLLPDGSGAGRLFVWLDDATDLPDGTLILADGKLGGFVLDGQFRPADWLAAAARQLDAGPVRRARLGLTLLILNRPNAAGHDLQIATVDPTGPAHAAGLRRGDLLLRLNGRPLGNAATLAAALAEVRGPTDFTINRDGQQVTVTVELAEP